MKLSSIANYPIFGIPLVVYGGLLTILLVIITAIVGGLVMKGKLKFSLHKFLAIITIIFALIHGFFAFASRFL